ncbi:Kp4-domain-containing protein [Bisporella sp. PMI_857]|nr:Kp4-domain-containing protein [Bisporella sp. PMI_857]
MLIIWTTIPSFILSRIKIPTKSLPLPLPQGRNMFSAFVPLSFLFPVLSSALGINCRGSALCGLASFTNNFPVAQGLRDAIFSSSVDHSTTYGDGDHIVCVSAALKISIGGDIIGINGKIGDGGVCVFPNNLEKPLNLSSVKELADALLEHNCKTCGSVPVHYVDEGSNNPNRGILTFNFVADPSCTGTCITSDEQNDAQNGTPDDPLVVVIASTSGTSVAPATVTPATATSGAGSTGSREGTVKETLTLVLTQTSVVLIEASSSSRASPTTVGAAETAGSVSNPTTTVYKDSSAGSIGGKAALALFVFVVAASFTL